MTLLPFTVLLGALSDTMGRLNRVQRRKDSPNLLDVTQRFLAGVDAALLMHVGAKPGHGLRVKLVNA